MLGVRFWQDDVCRHVLSFSGTCPKRDYAFRNEKQEEKPFWVWILKFRNPKREPVPR